MTHVIGEGAYGWVGRQGWAGQLSGTVKEFRWKWSLPRMDSHPMHFLDPSLIFLFLGFIHWSVFPVFWPFFKLFHILKSRGLLQEIIEIYRCIYSSGWGNIRAAPIQEFCTDPIRSDTRLCMPDTDPIRYRYRYLNSGKTIGWNQISFWWHVL